MLGIIGGSGLYSIEGLKILEHFSDQSPFGLASGQPCMGELKGHKIVFLARHASGHKLLPSEINYRANIWALKKAGVSGILSISACGSLREKIAPGSLALASQYFDFTKGHRKASFFGDGLVAHISSAEAACPILSSAVIEAAKQLNFEIHQKLCYACVEGPRLGTRAESFFLRQIGADIVGMTNVPEAFLALEAQIPYCTLGIVTDYDCWLDDPTQHASVDKVMSLYAANLSRVKNLIEVLSKMSVAFSKSPSRKSLTGAIMTAEKIISPEKMEILKFLQS